MNAQLLMPFSKEEVVIAFNQMESITAPGPNGMPPLFYHAFWNLIGDEVSLAVIDYLNNYKPYQHHFNSKGKIP